MAETTTKKKSTTKKTTNSTTNNKPEVTTPESNNKPEVTTPESNNKPVAREIDLSQYIEVINGFQGRLIYISQRTGETFTWDEFGDVQEIELRELRNAKSAAKGFFEHNWFMFNDYDQWVIDYLGVGTFYKNALRIDEFDEVFKKTPEEITDIVSKLSNGQKRSLSYRARTLIEDGTIDSRKAIEALEKSLNVELIEK